MQKILFTTETATIMMATPFVWSFHVVVVPWVGAVIGVVEISTAEEEEEVDLHLEEHSTEYWYQVCFFLNLITYWVKKISLTPV